MQLSLKLEKAKTLEKTLEIVVLQTAEEYAKDTQQAHIEDTEWRKLQQEAGALLYWCRSKPHSRPPGQPSPAHPSPRHSRDDQSGRFHTRKVPRLPLIRWYAISSDAPRECGTIHIEENEREGFLRPAHRPRDGRGPALPAD